MFNNSKIKRLEEEITTLKGENRRLHRLQFRVGDKVYVKKDGYAPLLPVYLRKEYNGGTCYYISHEASAPFNESHYNGVNIDNMSQTPPATCHCCGSQINQTSKLKEI